MPKLNVQQNNANIIKAFKVALETSHRNLLDNWYFVGGGSQLGDGIFPINQRGQTSYGNGQTFDRWKLSAGGTVTLTQNGITFNGLLFQKKALDLVVGETYTLSRQTQTGEVVSLTGVVPSTEGWMIGSDAFGVYFRPSTKVCDIQIWGDYSLRAMKLEKGTVSTLANDVPPDFGEELRKCQMYLRSIYARSGGTYVGIGMGFSSNSYEIELPFSMRATPTASYSGTIEIYAPSGTHTVSAVSVFSASTDTVELRFTVSGTVTTYENGHIYMANGAKILLSAEL